MITETTSSWHRDEFIRAIRQVRRRWRLKVALRGVTLVAGVGLAAFLAKAFDGFRRGQAIPGQAVDAGPLLSQIAP